MDSTGTGRGLEAENPTLQSTTVDSQLRNLNELVHKRSTLVDRTWSKGSARIHKISG